MPDQVSDVVKALLLFLGGGGGWKLAQMIRDAWREHKPKAEREQEKIDKEDRAAIDITEQLRALAKDAVADVRAEIATEREKTRDQGVEIRRLTVRVAQLEKVLHDNHIEVPAEVVPS